MNKWKHICKLIWLVCMLFSACTRLTTGSVVEKVFEPAHNESVMMYNAILKMPMMTTRYYPDRWYLWVRGVYKDKIITERWQVTKKDYDRFQIGIKITRGK